MSWGTIVFIAAAAFVFYVMAGYPLLVALLAFFPAPEVQIRKNVRSVSVLIPVHNGERWIRRKLQSLFSMEYPRELLEIIIISDGSTDATEAIVSEYAGQGIVLLKVPKGGKPAALNAGMARATGDIIFFTDVRQDVDPICLRCLVECLEDPKVGAVSGQHVILDGETNEEASVGLYWRFEWWVRGKLNRATSMLVVTGCVYAMRRNMVKPIPTDLLIDDCYLPVGALLQGYRIFWDERAKVYDLPTALDAEFSRKARSLAGLIQLVGYYPRLLLPVYKQWWHFLSYKLSRLLLPYALILVFATSFALPNPLELDCAGSSASLLWRGGAGSVGPGAFTAEARIRTGAHFRSIDAGDDGCRPNLLRTCCADCGNRQPRSAELFPLQGKCPLDQIRFYPG